MNSKDTQALKKLIAHYEQFNFNRFIALIDTSFIVCFVSEPLFKILQISKITHDIRGKTVIQLMQLVNRPQYIIELTKRTLDKVLKYDCIADQIGINLQRESTDIILQYRLTPIHNKITGNIIAIEAEVSSLKFPLLLSNPAKLLKSGSRRKNENEFLSTRQQEVLFLQFHCKSAKEIAEKLSLIHNKTISLHTIGTINKQLYQKFGVYNLEKLLETTYSLGYNRKIPTSLLSDHSVDIQDL